MFKQINAKISSILYARNLRRAKKISNFLSKYIKENSEILDIGSGNGYIADQLEKDCKSIITGIDVIDYNEADIKFQPFDGKTIPFQDNSFDYSMIIEVLHHCDNQEEILKEAKRVGKKILILEDIYTTKFHLIFVKLYDFMANVRHGVNIPFNFRTDIQWRKTFENLGLTIEIANDYISHPFYSPMKTKIYLLRK